MMTVVLCFFLISWEDPTGNRLSAAKVAYEREMEALKPLTIEWFDKERTARRGDRRVLRELEDSRMLFEKNFEPPPGLEPPLLRRFASAASWLESCYEAAVREYRAANELDRANATLQEWQKFRIDGRGTMQPEIKEGIPYLIVANCSHMALTIDRPTGSAAGAAVVQRPPDEGDDAQHWYVSLERVGKTTTFSFNLKKYNLWMQVSDWSHNSGAVIILWHGEGKSRNERWIPLQCGAWLNLHGAESGLLLSVREGLKRPGTQIIQWTPGNAADEQRFHLLPVRALAKDLRRPAR